MKCGRVPSFYLEMEQLDETKSRKKHMPLPLPAAHSKSMYLIKRQFQLLLVLCISEQVEQMVSGNCCFGSRRETRWLCVLHFNTTVPDSGSSVFCYHARWWQKPPTTQTKRLFHFILCAGGCIWTAAHLNNVCFSREHQASANTLSLTTENRTFIYLVNTLMHLHVKYKDSQAD